MFGPFGAPQHQALLAERSRTWTGRLEERDAGPSTEAAPRGWSPLRKVPPATNLLAIWGRFADTSGHMLQESKAESGLLERARSGDAEAFESLVRPHLA